MLDYESGKYIEICIAGHSEANCIANAARMGVCTKDATLYCDCGIPCKECLIILINSGVSEVVYNALKEDRSDYDNGARRYIIENSNLVIRGVNREE